eukprot:3660730-Rhodomonas_salina.1
MLMTALSGDVVDVCNALLTPMLMETMLTAAHAVGAGGRGGAVPPCVATGPPREVSHLVILRESLDLCSYADLVLPLPLDTLR